MSTVINAIYTMTGNSSYLFQVKSLTWEHGGQQALLFQQSLLEGKDALYRVDWDFIQGEHMEGVVIGGNTRCFLKLAGTPYMPDFSDKILFLESLGGGKPELITYLNQLKQMGAFQKISGLLLGTFTKFEEKESPSDLTKLVQAAVGDPALPIAKTQQIGHGSQSRCFIIGAHYDLCKTEPME